MRRRILLFIGLVILGLATAMLVCSPQAEAGLDVTPSEGFTTSHGASTFPAVYTIDILLTGATKEQVDSIIVSKYPNDPGPDIISGSLIEIFYNQDKDTLIRNLRYENPGSYLITVRVYNTSYENGTEKPQDEQLIQTKDLSIILTKKDDESNDPVELPIDMNMIIIAVVVLVVVVGLILGVKLIQNRGGLSMPSLSRGPPLAPGGLPLPPTGAPSSLGEAHGADEAPKGPVAKRDCPSCKTPIPIETEERPLKIVCPNANCGRSFTLKAKSGAVPKSSPATAGQTKSGPKGPSRGPGKSSKGTSRRAPRKKPSPTRSGPKTKAKSPPRPRAPAKGKPPAPKPKPLHCPNDGNELKFYPGAAKEYGYDSDYFCPHCELYVKPREKGGGKAKAGKPASRTRAPAKTPTTKGPKSKEPEGPFGKTKSEPTEKKASPLPVPESEDVDKGGMTVTCPSCDKTHEVPDAMTKNVMCTCGRRIRVKR